MNSKLLLRSSLLSLISGAALVLSACPQVPPADPLEPAPTVSSFTVSASEVTVGTTVKLTWATENATTVKIDELKLGSVSGVSGTSGEVDVAITGDSTFVLTARNARGASDTAIVSVRVGTAAGELLFTALPNSVSAGEPVTLAWSAPGGGAVSITATPGGPIDLGGQSASGSVVVNPTENTTYTLTAGVRTSTKMVTVKPTLLSFEASSLSADAGATITLSWSTANATRVQLSAPGRGNLVDEMDAARVASGSFTDTLPTQVDPGQLFSYQLTVTGPGATLTDSVVISIAGNPAIASFTAPKYLAQGSDAGITLRWSTREADSVAISTGGVEFYRAPPSAVAMGSLDLPAPAADVTYTLTAANSRGGEVTKTATVDLVGPPTVTLTASPNMITAGSPVMLSWSGTDVRNVRISSPLAGTIFQASDTTDTGNVPTAVSFADTAVVRIDVDNGAGQSASATTTVTVTNAVAVSVPAGSIRAGERVELSWTPATTTITGLPHDDVVVRSPSTGWDDITMTGAQVSFPDSDGAAHFSPTGFSAPFFDRVVGQDVWMTADGYMSFSPVGNYNYSSTALPSSKIEPYSIAPCWADVSGTVGRWQVKPVTGGGNVLIVQWDAEFQVKVFSSGQIDVEYKAPGTCTNRGVRGPRGDDGFRFAQAPAADVGLTLFGPKTGSAIVPMLHEFAVVGSIDVNGTPSAISREVGAVVRPNELNFSEALVFPAAPVLTTGQWFELRNTRNTTIDLTGWSLTVSDGGTAGVLSGTIAPGAVKVVGASLDPSLNDDAGVEVELTGFSPGFDAGTIGLSRDGGSLSTFSWTTATQGTSFVSDFGPYRFSTDTSSNVARAQFCVPTTGFGGNGQLGAPGVANHCGFPYVWQELRGGYYDISATGTAGTPANLDDATFTVSLAAAPFPYFGTPQTSVNVSTNGFISFDGSTLDNQFTNNFPSTTDVNAVAVPFGADLIGASTGSGIFYKRVGPNEDPAAPAAHWIIQWHKWTHYDTYFNDFFTDGEDDLNFQVKLFDDGVIEYHYGKMMSGSSGRSGTGIRTVTWLENPAGTQALIINTRSYSPGISPNSAFRFSPR